MPVLLEASLQVHPFFPPFRLVEAPHWIVCPMRWGVSVHNTNVVNTVCPLLPEVTDQQVALLLRDLWRLHFSVVGGSACPGWRSLCPLHGAT